MKAPRPLELARNRSRANICPLFAICTGQKFRTVATLQTFSFFLHFFFWLLSFVARSVETSINCQKLSKFLMTVWRLITENRFVLRRVVYSQIFQFAIFNFPEFYFISIMLPWTVLWITRPNNWSIYAAAFEFLVSAEQFFRRSEKIEHVGNTIHIVYYGKVRLLFYFWSALINFIKFGLWLNA